MSVLGRWRVMLRRSVDGYSWVTVLSPVDVPSERDGDTIEVVPAFQLAEAAARFDELEAITQRYEVALQRIATGHPNPAKLAGDALDGVGDE